MRIVIALSGGVDSSVAAALLKEQGHELIGMTLRLFDCRQTVNERSCCGADGVAEARAAAGCLSIPHYVIDGAALFEEQVLERSWLEYARGRTPNPCIACNEVMKFGLLYQHARKLGAQAVATGHHARIEADRDVRPKLLRGADLHKDQSYFLFALTDEQLRMSRLPVGAMTKDEVRQMAHQLGLPNAARAESQDACIAQRGDLAEALREKFGGVARPGRFVDRRGQVLGEHQGVHRFTVGQRKGLGIALGQRAYVLSIDAESGDVVVDTDPEALKASGLSASWMRWHRPIDEGVETACQVQIRYRHQAIGATVTRLPDGEAKVTFAEAQGAVSPGQAAVLYDGEEVIGGGVIDAALDPITDDASS